MTQAHLAWHDSSISLWRMPTNNLKGPLVSLFAVFLPAELFLEAYSQALPAGISFPLGFVLFWTVYFTYLRPTYGKDFFAKLVRSEFTTLSQSLSASRAFHNTRQAPHRSHEASLPRNVLAALAVLGIQSPTTWNSIHQRYRVLAKSHHPDLNPDFTDHGERFMKIDAAYKLLVSNRRLFK